MFILKKHTRGIIRKGAEIEIPPRFYPIFYEKPSIRVIIFKKGCLTLYNFSIAVKLLKGETGEVTALGVIITRCKILSWTGANVTLNIPAVPSSLSRLNCLFPSYESFPALCQALLLYFFFLGCTYLLWSGCDCFCSTGCQ